MAEAKFTCRFQVAGKVLEIGEVQAFASGFTKRTLVIEASRDAEKRQNPIELTLKKDDCAKADSIGVGDFVETEGFVEGRIWEGPNGVRHFIDLAAKSIIVTQRAERPTKASNWNELLAVGAAYGEGKEAVKARGKAFGKASKDMQAADWQAIADAIIAAHAAPDAAAEEWDGDHDDMPF